MILCLGTTPTVQRTMTFASIVWDEVNRAASVDETASGKSPNVARVLRTLGEPVTATGFLGGDTGRFIRRDLDAAGVLHDFLEVTGRTRTCTTVVDLSTDFVTELVEESSPVTAADVAALLDRLKTLLPAAKLLVLSGSLAPGVPEGFYADCCRAAAATGTAVLLDARGAPLKLALAHKPLVIKPNRSELADTVGSRIETDDDLRAAIRQVVQAGPSWAVVTMGAKGAVVSDGASFWRVRIPTIDAVNPIGSGDSFAAGLAAGIHRGQPVPDACRLGAACGCANALTLLPGHVRAGDVRKMEAEVRVEPW